MKCRKEKMTKKNESSTQNEIEDYGMAWLHEEE